jgi:polyhydroxyalkanoate synthesis regulator phasin
MTGRSAKEILKDALRKSKLDMIQMKMLKASHIKELTNAKNEVHNHKNNINNYNNAIKRLRENVKTINGKLKHFKGVK